MLAKIINIIQLMLTEFQEARTHPDLFLPQPHDWHGSDKHCKGNSHHTLLISSRILHLSYGNLEVPRIKLGSGIIHKLEHCNKDPILGFRFLFSQKVLCSDSGQIWKPLDQCQYLQCHGNSCSMGEGQTAISKDSKFGGAPPGGIQSKPSLLPMPNIAFPNII